MGQEPSQIRQEIEETRAEMGDTVDALAYKADVKTRVKESVSDKRDRLVEQIQGTTHKVGEAAPDGQQVKDGAREVVGVAHENPLGLAIGGLAAGFLVGMLLPSSRIEDERVGPIADQVKETAGEAVDRGREVASQVAEQAVEGAKEVGHEAMDTAKHAGQEQADELKDSAREGAQEVKEQARA